MNRNPASHFSSSLNVTVVLCICVGRSTVETRDALQMWAITLPGCQLFYCNRAGAHVRVCVCVCVKWIQHTQSEYSSADILKVWGRLFLFVTDNNSMHLLKVTVNDSALWISKNTVRALCCLQNRERRLLYDGSVYCWEMKDGGSSRKSAKDWQLWLFPPFENHMNRNESLTKWYYY